MAEVQSALRLMKKTKVNIVGRSGGGITNPIAQFIIKNAEQLDEGGENGIFIPTSELKGYVQDVERGPNSILYSLRKQGLYMGYRKGVDESGAKGFWVFRKPKKVEYESSSEE
jgi:hypothetical protein